MGRTAPVPGFDAATVSTSRAGLSHRTDSALIPDHRNDENLAVGQLHLAFIRLHNRVVGQLADAGVPGAYLSRAHPGTRISTERDNLLSATPLWFYIFRESELNDGLLDGVGARIVADVFHRSIEASHHSMICDPAWRPSLGPDSHTFRMIDLLLHAFEANADLLNPVDAEPVVAIRRRRRLG